MTMTRGQRIGEKKAYIKAGRYLDNKKYRCLYDGCKNIAVKSHSQQKNGPLRAIAEEGKVYRLNDDLHNLVDVEKGGVRNSFVLKGIKESSVFPGFCTEHESLFSIFEQKGIVVNSQEQACALFFRTIGYEIARKRREIDRWSFLQDELTSVYQDPRTRDFCGFIGNLKRYLSTTADYHFNKAKEMLDSGNYDNLTTKWMKIDRNVNASCSSILNLELDDYFHYSIKNPEKPIPSFSFNLIPSDESTHIVVSWLTEFDDYSNWLDEAFESHETLECYVNRFCFCDSEDACISPKLWSEIEDVDGFMINMGHVMYRGKLDVSSVPKLIKL